MWCLADRNFYGIKLWQEAQATGASLLWRAKKSLILEREQVFRDGSYLRHLYPSTPERRCKRGGWARSGKGTPMRSRSMSSREIGKGLPWPCRPDSPEGSLGTTLDVERERTGVGLE